MIEDGFSGKRARQQSWRIIRRMATVSAVARFIYDIIRDLFGD
jgi:hypothetical protein